MKTFKYFLSEEPSLLIEGASFESIILSKLTPEELKVSKRYTIPEGGGKFTVARQDKEAFMKLFYEIPDKGVGNGEVAMYWLFNFQNAPRNSNRCKENRAGDAADLLIDRIPVEAKSYPKHDQKIALGKFKQDYTSREILSSLFGFFNLFIAFGTGSRKSRGFKSEIGFNIDDIKDALEKYNEIKELLEKNPELTKNFKVFKEIQTSMAGLERTLKTLSKSRLDLEDVETVASTIAANLVITKFGNKPGDGGYMVNFLRRDPLDIHFHQISFDTFDNEFRSLRKNFSVGSGELAINMDIFK